MRPEMRGNDHPAPSAIRCGSATLPSAAKTDCVVSIISSNRSVLGGRSRQCSNASHARRRRHLLGRRDLRQRDDEVRRQRAECSSSFVRKRSTSAAAALQLLAERRSDPDRRRQRAVAQRRATSPLPTACSSSSVRAVPKPSSKSIGNPPPPHASACRPRAGDPMGEAGSGPAPPRATPPQGRLLQRAQRHRTELPRRVRLEQVSASVHVNRLARGSHRETAAQRAFA
jgi:hypothetical protein